MSRQDPDEDLPSWMVDALDPGPVVLPAAIRTRVMDRLREAPTPAWRRLAKWTVRSRPVSVSPLGAVLAAAAVMAAVVLVRPDIPASDTVAVRFVYAGAAASRVAVTGEFAHWDPQGIVMQRNAEGAWVAEVSLTPGLHHYVFVVDGSWVADPEARSHVDDGFGRRNSVLLVTDPREI